MAVQISIRDVEEAVRDEIAIRAAREGKSMQEFLRQELERIARKPSMKAVLEAITARKTKEPRRIAARDILRARDADRR